MKKIFSLLVIITIFSLTFYYKEDILVYYNKYFSEKKQPTTLVKNRYFRDYDFKYVQNTDNFTPSDKQSILNIYYTVINSGMNNFEFYCPQDYENCINDVKDVANNQTIVSNINNFVHPYNSFKNLQTEIDSLGKITIIVEKNYTDEMQIILDYEINKIIKENSIDNLNLKDKIKTIHDFIVNNTKYDKDRSDNNIISYNSTTAYGVLIENYGLCGGYTDSMMLFLEKFQVKNYKISSENHVWNKVYLDNKWYNLDLTWDDPINSNGSNSLEHTFFLINDDEMLKNDKTEHTYDKDVYQN